MATIKSLNDKVVKAKIEADKIIAQVKKEKAKMANSYGSILVDKLDLLNVGDFRKFVNENSEELDMMMNLWLESKQKKVQPAVDHSTNDDELERRYESQS